MVSCCERAQACPILPVKCSKAELIDDAVYPKVNSGESVLTASYNLLIIFVVSVEEDLKRFISTMEVFNVVAMW